MLDSPIRSSTTAPGQSRSALGMSEIAADATGDPMNPHKSDNGYYTWVRFGFKNSLDSAMPEFNARLGVLLRRLRGLSVERETLDQLATALAPESTAPGMGTDEKAQRQRELATRKTIEYRLCDDEEAELAYLTKAVEIHAIEHEEATYGAALNWYGGSAATSSSS